jgi:hypothetical protein
MNSPVDAGAEQQCPCDFDFDIVVSGLPLIVDSAADATAGTASRSLTATEHSSVFLKSAFLIIALFLRLGGSVGSTSAIR